MFTKAVLNIHYSNIPELGGDRRWDLLTLMFIHFPHSVEERPQLCNGFLVFMCVTLTGVCFVFDVNSKLAMNDASTWLRCFHSLFVSLFLLFSLLILRQILAMAASSCQQKHIINNINIQARVWFTTANAEQTKLSGAKELPDAVVLCVSAPMRAGFRRFLRTYSRMAEIVLHAIKSRK